MTLIAKFQKSAILFLVFQSLCTAQTKEYNSQSNDRPSFFAKQLTAEPEIDGNILDDAIWKPVTPIGNLTQIKPSFGEDVSEKTEIRVGYTN